MGGIIMSRRTKKKDNKRTSIDASGAIVATVTNNKGSQRKVQNPVMGYGYRQIYLPSEYDLSTISLIEDGESYVRQAFQKKTALMFSFFINLNLLKPITSEPYLISLYILFIHFI